jgi:hypothetical protein
MAEATRIEQANPSAVNCLRKVHLVTRMLFVLASWAASAAFLSGQPAPTDRSVQGSMLEGERQVVASAATQNRQERDHIRVYIDQGAFAKGEGSAYADDLERYYVATARYLTRQFPFRRFGLSKPTVYVTNRAGISHVSGRGLVFLYARRTAASPAITIHEFVHLLLWSKPSAIRGRDDLPEEEERRVTAETAIWLIEGFPSHAACEIASQLRIRTADVFLKGDCSTLEAEAKDWLSVPEGRAVLPNIGTRGAPDRLLADREHVAAPFYLLSHLFSRYLTVRFSVAKMTQLYERHFNGNGLIESDVRGLLKAELARLRADWLASVEPGTNRWFLPAQTH